MKYLIIILSFFLCTFFVSAQKSRDLLYQFPKKKLSNNVADAEALYQKIISCNYNGISSSNLKRFALATAYEKEQLFLSGKVYIGWDKMEQYLNKVLQKILPDSLKNNPDIHVYPARIDVENAFVLFDGSIFFNVGLFANITNEASVAIILGHEMGHYLMKDNLYNFIRHSKLKRKEIKANSINKLLKFNFEYSKYSRQQEIIADSIGFTLAKKSGYDLYYGIDNFKRFQESEKAEELKKAPSRIVYPAKAKGQLSKSDILKLLQRYPENSERIENLNNFILGDSLGLKKDFQVSKSDFQELQEITRFETLNILLNTNLRSCIKNSFVYYLFNTENADYLYYLVESLRRYTSIDYRVKDHTFLTEDFLGKQFKKGEGILHNLSYLIVDSVNMSLIRPMDLTDSTVIEFENYGQAFNYFSEIAVTQNNREALLSTALMQEDTVKQNEYLLKYLSFTDCWYRDYAIALKNNEIYNSINKNTKDIIVYNRPEYYDATRFGLRRDYKYEVKLGDKILAKFSSFINSTLPGSELSRIDDPLYINMNDMIHFKNLSDASIHVRINDTIDRYDAIKKCTFKQINKGLDVFLIDPENWYFAKNNHIKCIREFNAYGMYDICASKIPSYLLATVFAWPYFIPYYIISGPLEYQSGYDYYSFDLVNNKGDVHSSDRSRKLSPNRYFRNFKRFLKNKKVNDIGISII